MGWTHLHKPSNLTPAAFLISNCYSGQWMTDSGRSIVGKATSKGVVYLALKMPASGADCDIFEVAADGTITTALVYLISRGEGSKSYYNFGYKDMCETMGPVESAAPASFLKLLSPLKSEAVAKARAAGGSSASYAQEWRDRCAALATIKRKALKLESGLKVHLPYPVRFTDGAEHDSFTVVHMTRRGRRQIVFSAGGMLYRLSADVRRALQAAS